MNKILIFSGTTEGRRLSEELSYRGVDCEVCVATEYGELVMPKEGGPVIHQGRLTVEEMEGMMKKEKYLAVVDATHPFATEVTENIRCSAQYTETTYIRLRRGEEMVREEDVIFFSSVAECVKALSNTQGAILLTTGSKELSQFCVEPALKERLVVRVLPGQESMNLCYQQGIVGKQLIAMQGPFSKEMNLAMIHQYGIQCLVTKESGTNSGQDEKVMACKEAGIPCYMIRRPKENIEETYDYQKAKEVVLTLWEQQGYKLQKNKAKSKLDIVLAGIGMGDSMELSVKLTKRLAETDYLFGAKRMLDAVEGAKEKYPYYLGRDILPLLHSIQEKEQTPQRVTILFSGDTGFYSGCKKLYEQLKELENSEVTIWPGTSSVSYFCAKIGMPWQNMAILSAHGTDPEVWKAELLHAVRNGKNVFFLTSGAEDIRAIGNWLLRYEEEKVSCIYLGYELSTGQEAIQCISLQDCEKVTQKGLYVGAVICKDAVQKKAITPGYRDEEFIRAQVPMTKEEVREISLCKMHLSEDAVLYDIGSGTGSIALEAALLSPQIQVYAIETNPAAVELIEKNKEKWGTCRVKVIHGLAPEALEALPAPTHAFIGGSKGNLREICEALYRKNPHMQVVMNAVSMESVAEMQKVLGELSIEEVDVSLVSVSKVKAIGAYHMLQANNPVYVFSFRFCEGNNQ